MKNLLYKDLKLGISPMFYVFPLLFGALMLIPGWLYLLVFMYFCFITVPNAFAASRVQNDLMFSILMPVQKRDIVQSKIISFIILELMHISFAAIFALLNMILYKNFFYYFLKPNIAFFGLAFLMSGLFNGSVFPLFFKTGYKYGIPVLVSSLTIVAYATAIEVFALFNSGFGNFLKYSGLPTQISILFGGIILFVLLSLIAIKISIKNFEKVDLG